MPWYLMGSDKYSDNKIAIFTTKKKGDVYIDKSTLKSGKFSKKSLLRNYYYAWMWYGDDDEGYSINPVLKKKAGK